MNDELASLTVMFTEFYYWVTIPLMFLIHVGFCMYEVGLSRRKNHLHTLMKNTMVIPLVTTTFFLFGWWIYFAFSNGPGITGGLVPAPFAVAWSEMMGPHMGGSPATEAITADHMFWARLNGVFWAAFLLFSWTAASIVSGACIERIRSAAFWIAAVAIGSVFWVIDAAWGWHPEGWMVQLLGYHDAYASGVIHCVAGGFALGILAVLGPRLGKFRPDGSARQIHPRNPWLVTVGIFLIYTGFWGFYAACNVPIFDIQSGEGTFFSATNIYLGPTTLSAITVNFLLALSAGMMTAYTISKGDAFWTYSGGLAGLIAASAGNDLYHPLQAFFVGVGGAAIAYYMHRWVEQKFKIDDAVCAVAVHGYAGFFGVIVAGFLLWGYPASPNPEYASINPLGQFFGAIIMFFVLGFVPGFALAFIMKAMDMLRVPEAIEIAGLDLGEIHQRAVDIQELNEADRRFESRLSGPISSRQN